MESSVLYELALKTSIRSMFAVVDAEGTIRFMSEKMGDWLGIDAASVIGRPCRGILSEDRCSTGACFLLSGTGDFIIPMEYLEEMHRGLERIEVRSLNLPDGTSAGFMHVWMPMDDEEKNRHLDTLTKYSAALHGALNGIYITKLNGEIIFVNKAFEDLFGYKLEEVLGRNPRILNPGPDVYVDFGMDKEEYDRIFTAMWDDVLSPDIGSWEGDVINRHKDGTLLNIRLYISAIRDSRDHIIGFFANPVDMTEKLKEQTEEKLEIYSTIARTAEARDEETGEHLMRMSAYSRVIAESMGMPRKFVEDMETFAPLHDIGKVGIPDSILLAPRSLSDEEFAMMRQHTTIGYDILKDKPSLAMAADIALCHHEWWNGKGYPKGLKKDNIPVAARITAIADVYDALRSKRPYKDPWTHERAVQYIENLSEQQFDPSVVYAFLKCNTQINDLFLSMR